MNLADDFRFFQDHLVIKGLGNNGFNVFFLGGLQLLVQLGQLHFIGLARIADQLHLLLIQEAAPKSTKATRASLEVAKATRASLEIAPPALDLEITATPLALEIATASPSPLLTILLPAGLGVDRRSGRGRGRGRIVRGGKRRRAQEACAGDAAEDAGESVVKRFHRFASCCGLVKRSLAAIPLLASG